MPPAQNTTQTQRGPSSNAAPAGARARRAPAPEEAQELQAELQKLDPEIHAAEGLSEAPSVAAPSAAEARRLAGEMADRLLANPVIESYRVEVDD